MNLESIIQSEVSQKEKDKYCILMYMYGIQKDGTDDPIFRAAQETQAQSLGQEDPLEEEMATHSCILAWEIPCPLGCKELNVTERLGTRAHTFDKHIYILKQFVKGPSGLHIA